MTAHEEDGARRKLIGGVDFAKPDFTVVEAAVSFWGPHHEGGRGNQGGVEIAWATASAGFGSLTLYLGDDGNLKVDSERMGKDFCKAVLAKLIDSIPDSEFQK